jgi:peptide-methionine (R)-S-oxide reductase
MVDKLRKSDEEWRRLLTPEQYRITRQKATEAPFTGEYVHSKTRGVYRCVACGNALFNSDTKFESGTGWPSFWAPEDQNGVELAADNSHGMRRIEVLCARCEAHLGHLFDDGPRPTGQRFCINSGALTLDPASED